MSSSPPLSHHRDDDLVEVAGFGVVTRKQARDEAQIRFMQTGDGTLRDANGSSDDLVMAFMKAAVSERYEPPDIDYVDLPPLPAPWLPYTLD